MVGVCGHRADGDPLNCPNSTRAVPPNADLAAKLSATCPTLWLASGGAAGRYCCTSAQVDRLAADTARVAPFVVGCPACAHDFVHLWCVVTCSGDQALFTNVTSVAPAADTGVPTVERFAVWVAARTADALYDACADVGFGPAGTRALDVIGGGARSGAAWLAFLGLVKDARSPPVGSPFQIDFFVVPNSDNNSSSSSSGGRSRALVPPPGITPWDEVVPGCSDAALACSCADCPSAPGCAPSPPLPPPSAPPCQVGGATCWEAAVAAAYVALLAAAGGIALWARRHTKTRADDSLEPLLYHAEEESTKPARRCEANASLSKQPPPCDQRCPPVERWLRARYARLGALCARRPWTVLAVAVVLLMLATAGLTWFRLETDPAALWVGRGSRAAADRAAFEAAAGGPFYRVAQLILATPASNNDDRPPILGGAAMEVLFSMQAKIDALVVPYDAGELPPPPTPTVAALEDVCVKPFVGGRAACATVSPLQWWQEDASAYTAAVAAAAAGDRTAHTPSYCAAHWASECRAAFGAPVDPHVVLGGSADSLDPVASATALIATFPLDATLAKRKAAAAWEAAFLALARGELTSMASAANLTLSFSAERSLQDELARESYADAGVVAASYGAMLVYVALALSAFPSSGGLANVGRRVVLGAVGVAIVAASVAGALGLLSAVGVPAALIVMEVVPFLALAIGVDNMFLLAHALGRTDPLLPLEVRASLALSSAGPSITLASACEVLAFALGGGLSAMPAVRNFGLCAALAVALDFGLQITAFMAVLVLEERGRQRQKQQQQRREGAADDKPPASLTSLLQLYMQHVHVPALEQPLVQAAIALAFLTGLFVSAALVPRLSVGLDQALVLPRDSYLQAYFADVTALLRVGPPLFFMLGPLNVSTAAPDVARVCGVAGCAGDSLMARVAQAARAPASSSYIAAPAASWLDDFLGWASPLLPQCCRRSEGGTPALGPAGSRCPPADQPPCLGNASACAKCVPCFAAPLPAGRPDTADFVELLPWFLDAVPSAACAKGGAGVYSAAVARDAADPTGVAGLSCGVVAASVLRTSHTPLHSQADFIAALAAARRLADAASAELGLRIAPYSPPHVFFEQYLHIWRDAFVLLGLPLAAVCGAAWLLTGSAWGAAVLSAMLLSLLVHLCSAMAIGGLQVNALSLVNLAASLGVAVEFGAHVLHAFCAAHGDRRARAKTALLKAGAPVTAGIVLTKLVGVAVLARARTRVFETYFFYMYSCLVVLGAAHGLVLLPVMLRWLGPPSWAGEA